jgi:outer membrane protein assembly factor BamB
VTAVPPAAATSVGIAGLPVHPLWKHKHKAHIGSVPVAVGPLLALVDHKGKVTFIDPNSGRPREQVKAKGAIAAPPVWDAERFYVLSRWQKRLQGYAFKGGKRLWYKQFSREPEAPIVFSEELLLPVGDSVYAIDRTSGAVSSAVAAGGDQWLTPVPQGNRLVLLGRFGTVRQLDTAAAVLWQIDIAAPCEAPPGVADQHIVVATGDGIVICLDPDGTEVWSVELDSESLFTPSVTDSTVIVAGVSGAVWALDLTTGEERWTSTLPGPGAGGACVRETWLAATSVDGTLSILDPGDGRVLHEISLGTIVHQPPVWAFGRLFVASDRTLYAFGIGP